MYNPLRIIFKCKDVSEVIFKCKDVSEVSIHILPYPNMITIYESITCLPFQVQGILENINPSHKLIKQFKSELFEDFQIDVTWNEGIIKLNKENQIFLKTNQESEGYLLNIEKDYIILHSATLHGLFNAFQSFRQILMGGFISSTEYNKGINLRQLEIVDWPCMSIRGVADDVSRGQIPTIESAKHFIRDISRFKNNYYALYIEDVFKCSKHPKIGKNRGAFTPEELIELDRYAKSRFVTIFPIFQTLGHFDNILTIPEYQDLGEFPGAQCLSVANGNIYPLLRDFIDELSPCFSSRIFHIGCDESFDLGHGNSKDLIKAVGMDGALLDHIRKVYNIAKTNRNDKVLLYHDVVIKYPTLLEKLPKDLIFMYWDYSPKKNYAKIKKIVEAGFSVIISPSMLCWSRHFPNYRVAAKNIINIIEYSKKLMQESQLILGQLNSTWGDFSNHNLRENNIYGAILSGTASWTISKINYEDFVKELGFCFFGLKETENINKFFNIFSGLSDINQLYQKKPVIVFQNFYNYLYRHPFYDDEPKPNIKQYKKILSNSQKILENFRDLKEIISINIEYVPYIEYSIEIAKFFAEKESLRVHINSKLKPFKIETIPSELIDECCELLESFVQQSIYLSSKYEKLWRNCAKLPHLYYPLTKFKNLITFFEEKKMELRKGIPFVNPLLPSAYIWTKERISHPKSRYFRKEFNLEGKIQAAKIQVIAGNFGHIFINGEYIGNVSSRMSLSILPLSQSVRVFDIKPFLKKGKNVIGIEANHYLESKGFLNVYIKYLEENIDSTFQEHEIISDSSWIFSLKNYSETNWSTPEFEIDKNWNHVKVLGYSPKINGYIYKPSLLDGGKSYTEDDFGLKSNVYFIFHLIFGKLIARIIRFFIR